MDRNMRVKLAVVVLVVLTLGSVGVASFAYGVQTSAGTYQTGVFAKVNGSSEYIWLTITPTWTNMLSLSLPNVPITAYYHVVCDGQAYANGGFEIAIGFDYWDFWDSATRRVYDGGGGYGVHTERVYKLGPGAHTFYFKGRKFSSFDAGITGLTITVTVFTDGSVIDLS